MLFSVKLFTWEKYYTNHLFNGVGVTLSSVTKMTAALIIAQHAVVELASQTQVQAR